MNRDLLKAVLFLLSYSFLSLSFYTIILSCLSFINLILDQSLGDIENWISYYRWEIIISSKIFSIFFISKILNLNSNSSDTFLSYLQRLTHKPGLRAFYLILIILSIIFFSLEPNLIRNLSNLSISGPSLISYLGMSLYFYLEFTLVSYITYKTNLKSFRFKFLTVSVAIISFFITTLLFNLDYGHSNAFYYFCLVMLSVFVLSKEPKLSTILMFSFLFIGPCSILLGFDLHWGKDYALFSVPNEKLTVPFLSALLVALCYYFTRVTSFKRFK